MGISETNFPYTGPYSVEGNGKHKGNTAIALKRAMARMGKIAWEPDKWDNVFNKKLESALDEWDAGKNGYAEGRWEKIRNAKIPTGLAHAGQWALDSECQRLVKEEGKKDEPWKNVGPIFNGGASVLKHDCTHATSGISCYPAYDDAFTAGTVIIAPENIEVTKASSSNPGDACYAEGESGLRYWFGHLVSAPSVGTKIKKGGTVGKVISTSQGGGSHVHLGVNVEKLWGSGKQLKHNTNYTHGAPLIGDQLGDH
jgi:hypothetical protein